MSGNTHDDIQRQWCIFIGLPGWFNGVQRTLACFKTRASESLLKEASFQGSPQLDRTIKRDGIKGCIGPCAQSNCTAISTIKNEWSDGASRQLDQCWRWKVWPPLRRMFIEQPDTAKNESIMQGMLSVVRRPLRERIPQKILLVARLERHSQENLVRLQALPIDMQNKILWQTLKNSEGSFLSEVRKIPKQINRLSSHFRLRNKKFHWAEKRKT